MFAYKFYNETTENKINITTCTRSNTFSINMRSLGNYLVYIICVLETLLNPCCGYEPDKFLGDMLSLHNTTRVLHGANGLEYDLQMSYDAMKCLKALYFDEFPSDGKPACGEPYYYIFYESESGKKESATKIFSKWYIQAKGYDYTREPIVNASFTQIVWKSTTNIGLAVVQQEGKNFVVVVYKPAGNFLGKYLDNVGRPIIRISGSSSS